MSDDDNLPTIIGEMKRAAIDAFMADQGWKPHFLDNNVYSLWGVIGASAYHRPGTDGSGGGDAALDGFSEWGESLAPSFNGIRGTIDGHMEPWLDLPDGSRCSDPKTAAGNAGAIFGASATNASIQDSGDIFRSSPIVSDQILNNIDGSFKAPFHTKYSLQFAKVTAGLGTACAILEINYATQLDIWPAAKIDVLEIAVATRDALIAKAEESQDASTKVILTVIGAAAGAVASVVTAGAALPAVLAMVGFASAATVGLAVVDLNASVTGTTYTEILESLGSALQSLSDGIETHEDALNTMMGEAASYMESNASSFDLDAFSLPVFPGAAEEIRMQRADANIISSNMSNISGALGDAGAFLGASPGSNPTWRDNSIGAGSNGTHVKAQALYDLTARCITLTHAEYDRGQKLFEATVEDYFATDADVAKTLAAMAADEALIETL